MPVMDGFKLCKEVKGKDELKNIPFIFYTATYKDERDERLALMLGADKYILKPAEPEELINIIQGVIRDVEEGKFEPKKPALDEEEEVFKLYCERLVNKLEKKMLDLEKEITVRNQAEKRIEHLSFVLRAIRSVNQLIVKERDRDRLIQDACRNFIKNRGFYSAWIALVDESRRLVTAAEAGLGKAFQPLLKNLKQGNQPICVRRVLAKPGILTIKDPASTCGDCPLANIYKERGVFSSRLEHDGKIYGILTVSFPLDYFSGKEERSLFEEVVGDIAYALRHIEMEEERKRAEESLQKSEEKYRTLTDNVNVGVYRNILGPKGKFIEINPAIVKMFGYKSKKELLSINVADLYQNPEGRRKFNAKILQDGFVKNEELQLKKKDGTPIIGSVSAVVIKDNKGKVKYYDGVIEDVTERKLAEEALRIERDNLTRILESMEDGVYIVNQQYDIEYVNSLLMKEFGQPRKKKCYEYFHDRKEVCPWCQNKDVFAGKTVRWEWHSFKNQKTYDLIDTPIKKPDGSISKLEIFRDITERKKAEEQIKASLKEKEVLLQEVHHRVKNNMQLISSLFSLQSRHIKDKQAFEIFKSSQNRVRSMAIIHERFYQSKDFARVDFAEYVQSLTSHLLSSYGINPDVIKLNINIKDAFLDLNTAIPCGLIINELLSNSLKHAFPDDKKGEINIAMRSLKGNEIELIVTDNGVGLPKGIDFIGTKTLGLHLVRILAKDQLHGDIKLDRAKGTSFSIRFRRKP